MDEIIWPDMTLAAQAKRAARSFVPRAIRNWLRSPTASARWVWDNVKFSCGVRKVVQLRPGWSLVCHPAAYRCAYYAQESDPEQVAEFDGFIKHSSEGMLLLDVGAHFGLFSFAALHYGGPQARAIAIDPSPVAVNLMNVQAKLNGSAERVQIIQAAVSDVAGWHDMLAVGVLASGYYVAPTANHPASELSHARALTLDGIASELKVAPTHIKIDVEGDEAAVLRGGRNVLSQTPAPIIFIEIHNEIVESLGGNPAETLGLLKDYGYQTFASDGSAINDDAILSQPLIRVVAKRAIAAA
jgi:FkbM family methyltransferase